MYADKKIVCVSGSLWAGSHNTPWRMLEKDGFQSARWFTTDRQFSGDKYRLISLEKFHIDFTNDKILAYMKYGGGFFGINFDDVKNALKSPSVGALIVGFGFQDIIAQVANRIPQAIIFTVKNKSMDTSPHLFTADSKGQLHRIDVNVLELDAWTKVYNQMLKTLNHSARTSRK